VSTHQVTASTNLSAAADTTWAFVRDFCQPWHPSITKMLAEYDDDGRLIRAFSVQDEQTTYRERLTWFSDSERSYAYTHVDGIEGVDDYQASLKVTTIDSETCNVTMSAQLSAQEPRASDIASGTQAIFDEAIDTLKSLLSDRQVRPNGDNADYASSISASADSDTTATSKIIPGTRPYRFHI